MDKKTLIATVKKMAVAHSCCPDLKRAVQRYLVALDTPKEEFAAQSLIAEIEKDITPIDKLVEFAHSARAIQILGKEAAKKLSAHVNQLTASGAKYCDCDACAPAAIVLANKEILLTVEKPEEPSVDKQTLINKIKELGATPTCYSKLKQEVKNYLDAVGTDDEKIAAENLIAEIKADIVPIDLLVIFTHSNRAIEMFGAKRAKIFADNADALKAGGAKYCNCRACTLGVEILEHKDILLNEKFFGGIVMTKADLQEKIREMAAAPSCCPGLKQEVQNYFAAVGMADEKIAAQKLIAEIERDITPIDALVVFAHSDHAALIFGAEGAKKFAAHADALKASGATYCDCGACTPAREILKHKEILVG